jgi:hypothetical protein
VPAASILGKSLPDFSRAPAMDPSSLATSSEAGRRLWPSAQPAMHPAAPILHGGCLAKRLSTSLCAASRRYFEISWPIPVLEPTSSLDRLFTGGLGLNFPAGFQA